MVFIEDISNVPKNGHYYNGNSAKYGITMDGVDYIVKGPKDNDMSVYSEYLASNFICQIGIPCQKVRLGICNGRVVDIIEDFTSGTDWELHSFKDTKQSSVDTELSGKEYTYEDVLYLIEKHLKMGEDDKKRALNMFWDMFICDAILGNRDRHWGNWGYLRKKGESGGYQIAPIYDNGSSLYPGVNSVIDRYKDENSRMQFVYDRTIVFPASLFKIKREDRSYRTNYYEMFENIESYDWFAERVGRIKKDLSYERVIDVMAELCGNLDLDVWQRRFYVEIVVVRYMAIVLRYPFDEAYRLVEGRLNGYE